MKSTNATEVVHEQLSTIPKVLKLIDKYDRLNQTCLKFEDMENENESEMSEK